MRENYVEKNLIGFKVFLSMLWIIAFSYLSLNMLPEISLFLKVLLISILSIYIKNNVIFGFAIGKAEIDIASLIGFAIGKAERDIVSFIGFAIGKAERDLFSYFGFAIGKAERDIVSFIGFAFGVCGKNIYRSMFGIIYETSTKDFIIYFLWIRLRLKSTEKEK